MFEIHLSFGPLIESEISSFVDFCQSIEVKPIIIELASGEVAQQPMISKLVLTEDKDQFFQTLEDLKAKFLGAGYSLKRTKIEVPLEYISLGKSFFPDYKGGYFEWHGKIEFTDKEALKTFAKGYDVHLSRNSLKGETNRRFVTIRNYSSEKDFRHYVEWWKKRLPTKDFTVVKEEFEYCIYDSNKKMDRGWIDTIEITDFDYLNLLAFEAFLRRAISFRDKFILKGSLLTRQYIGDKSQRKAADLDFVYGLSIDKDVEPGKLFSTWLTKVTEEHVDDGVLFKSFSEDDFWRGIDYAMHDDFPTVNTDLRAKVYGQNTPNLPLDISWNLPLEEEPIPLLYQPIVGEPFTIPYTVPLCLQVSWKLHQTVVRPRLKDVIDIILLLEHNELSELDSQKVAQYYVDECQKDKVNPNLIKPYFDGEMLDYLYSTDYDSTTLWKDEETLVNPFSFKDESYFSLYTIKNTYNNDLGIEDWYDLFFRFEQCLKAIKLGERIQKLLE